FGERYGAGGARFLEGPRGLGTENRDERMRERRERSAAWPLGPLAPWPLALALGASACGGSPTVTRIVGAETLRGPFVDGDAYAAFFRGAAAEEHGKWPEALAAYEEARSYDEDDPEIWTRIGSVRCKANAADADGPRSLARALEIDPDYGPAHLAMALCGQGDRALEVAYAG